MDTGLHSLVAIARFHQVPADSEQLAHQFGEPGKLFSDASLLLAAKALTFRAKRVSPSLSKISNDVLPTIAKAADGNYFGSWSELCESTKKRPKNNRLNILFTHFAP